MQEAKDLISILMKKEYQYKDVFKIKNKNKNKILII